MGYKVKIAGQNLWVNGRGLTANPELAAYYHHPSSAMKCAIRKMGADSTRLYEVRKWTSDDLYDPNKEKVRERCRFGRVTTTLATYALLYEKRSNYVVEDTQAATSGSGTESHNPSCSGI